MIDQLIHEVECLHPDCQALLRIREATPAGVYFCQCKQIRVRLSWSTGVDFRRSPYLTLEPKEGEPTP